MGLSIWTEEGNKQDLSFFFVPVEEKQLTSQAADTPAYLNQPTYVKAAEKTEAPVTIFNFLPILLIAGALFALGVIKL